MLNLLFGLRQSFWLLLVLLLGIKALESKTWANPAPTPALCTQDLAPVIDEIIGRSLYRRSHWGILIQPLDSNQSLYSLNAQRFFVPASNTKLLTSAAVLLQLSPNFRFRTPLYTTGTPPDLKVLHLVAQGDPSLTTADLQRVAQELKEHGVRQIDQLLIEAADFPRGNINPTWEWEDILFNYGTGASQVVLNENTVTLTLSPQGIGQPLQWVWSDAIAGKQWVIDNQTITRASASSNLVSIKGILGEPSLILTGELDIKAPPDVSNLRVLDPQKYFLESFQAILFKEGIRVNKVETVKAFMSSNLETLFSTIESPTLSELLKKVNQDSNTLYTESLAVLLSKNQLENNLTNLGIDPEGYSLIDGSGLSRQNLITPETLVKTLILMARSPYGEVYKDSLAMAGKTGTLQGRFKDTVVEGKLRAKTGTLSGNSALSGYLDTENDGVIVFSIVVNGSDQNVSILRSGIDEIVLNLAKLKKC